MGASGSLSVIRKRSASAVAGRDSGGSGAPSGALTLDTAIQAATPPVAASGETSSAAASDARSSVAVMVLAGLGPVPVTVTVT